VIEHVLLPGPYASSLGGFVEFPTALWYGVGGIFSSLWNSAMKRNDTRAPADMDSMSLIGGGLIAGEAIAFLTLGHHRPRFARALMSPFRSSYLRYEELTRIVHEWARAHPDLVRVASLGKSPEGRDLWLLEIGADPDRLRAAAWIDATCTPPKCAARSVALAIAEDVIAVHRGADQLDLPIHVKERLKSVLFYVLRACRPTAPRRCCATGASCARIRATAASSAVARWVSGDVDGDGQVLSPAQAGPSGEYVEDPDLPGVMLPRRLEDAGPYTSCGPKARSRIRRHPRSRSALPVGQRRRPQPQLPALVEAEPEQVGAGPFGASEPESRAVIEGPPRTRTSSPGSNLHTFGGVYIRPLGNAPDTKMNQSDLALYPADRRMGREDRRLPDGERLRAVHLRAGKADLRRSHRFRLPRARRDRLRLRAVGSFRALGIERKKPFVDHLLPSHARQPARAGEARRDQNQGRILPRLEAVPPPALGDVEVGGTVTLVD